MRTLKKREKMVIKKKKKDFSCLTGLVIKLRESNVNRCGKFKTSTWDILLLQRISRHYGAQNNPDEIPPGQS